MGLNLFFFLFSFFRLMLSVCAMRHERNTQCELCKMELYTAVYTLRAWESVHDNSSRQYSNTIRLCPFDRGSQHRPQFMQRKRFARRTEQMFDEMPAEIFENIQTNTRQPHFHSPSNRLYLCKSNSSFALHHFFLCVSVNDLIWFDFIHFYFSATVHCRISHWSDTISILFRFATSFTENVI